MVNHESILKELVRRIVDLAHPLRIILFGSSARNQARSARDIDLLVVMPDGTHRRHTAQHIYQLLTGIKIPVDIIVATPADLEKYKDTIGLIYREVVRKGRELYAA